MPAREGAGRERRPEARAENERGVRARRLAERVGDEVTEARLSLEAPERSRLVEARVGDAPLRDDASYRVAVSSHLASGGDGHVEIAAAVRSAGGRASRLDADALAEHLGRLSAAGPVLAPPAGRITIRTAR